MSITFYGAPMSSASPVAWALAELEVPHEKISVDLSAGDQKKPEFLKLNPNGKVPTLVADGTPMFEALAIMLWLGERYGVERKQWPAAQDPARPQALSWSVWAYVTYGTLIGRHFLATSERVPAELHNAAQAARASQELQGLLGILNDQLTTHPYLIGPTFSIADLIVAAAVGWGAMTGVSVASHPNVKAWLERCQARPSYRVAWAPAAAPPARH